MASIGEELRRERQRRGVTIKDVEQVLHIRATYLEALEEDNYKIIPGDVYVKGFIGNYADYLGLDRQRLVESYKSLIGEPPGIPLRRLKPRKLHEHKDVEREREPETLKPGSQRLTYTSRRQRRQKTIAQERIALTVILVFVIIFLVWLFFF